MQAQVEQAQVVQQSLLFSALRVAGKIVIPKGGTALGNSLWNQMQLMFHLPGAKIQEEGEGRNLLREHPFDLIAEQSAVVVVLHHRLHLFELEQLRIIEPSGADEGKGRTAAVLQPILRCLLFHQRAFEYL